MYRLVYNIMTVVPHPGLHHVDEINSSLPRELCHALCYSHATSRNVVKAYAIILFHLTV